MEQYPLTKMAEPTMPTGTDGLDSGSEYTEEGEKEILERLEGLGYLG
jgi:hypothetical protein